MVSIPLHQVVRATCPLITTVLYRVLYSRTFPRATYLSLIPIVLGAGIATYGDFTYTRLGLALTFLGVVLAGLKTIVTNRMMTGSLALTFWEILLRMSPLAFIQSIIYAYMTGELAAFNQFIRAELLSPTTTSKTTPTPLALFLILAGNGLLAFLLNISNFSTNRLAGALTMTVCANVKQCLTIVLGIVLFNVRPTPTNLCGLAVTVSGCVLYSFIELNSKKKKTLR